MLWYKDPWKKFTRKEKLHYLWNECSTDKSVLGRLHGAIRYLFFCRVCGVYEWDLPLCRFSDVRVQLPEFSVDWSKLNPYRRYKRWKRRKRKAEAKRLKAMRASAEHRPSQS